MKLFFLLFIFLPLISFSQQGCIIHIEVSGVKEPAKLYLIKSKDQRSFKFSDSSVTIMDTIQSQGVIEFLVSYKGSEKIAQSFSVYATYGEIKVNIFNDDKGTLTHIQGAEISQNYNDLLYEPVVKAVVKVNALKSELKKKDKDTVILKDELTEAIQADYGIPREFIKKSPNSPLAISALQMMGNGDPTVPHPIDELTKLFYSLSPAIQNSKEGQAYAGKLHNMLN